MAGPSGLRRTDSSRAASEGDGLTRRPQGAPRPSQNRLTWELPQGLQSCLPQGGPSCFSLGRSFVTLPWKTLNLALLGISPGLELVTVLHRIAFLMPVTRLHTHRHTHSSNRKQRRPERMGTPASAVFFFPAKNCPDVLPPRPSHTISLCLFCTLSCQPSLLLHLHSPLCLLPSLLFFGMRLLSCQRVSAVYHRGIGVRATLMRRAVITFYSFI